MPASDAGPIILGHPDKHHITGTVTPPGVIPDQTGTKLAAVVAAAEVAASMYDAYQGWALSTYGDSAKTKTVTKKKYHRIVRILRGEESSSVENSKFRFWVKAKGFKLVPDSSDQADDVLYVPNSKPNNSTGGGRGNPNGNNISQQEAASGYKKVAVVENFYDIIYNVHVVMDGRSGKHAGQKRTYRAVAEMYAFLPREAVTRFLMSCSDCQKRMHLTCTNTGFSPKPLTKNVDSSASSPVEGDDIDDDDHEDDHDHEDENVPVSTTPSIDSAEDMNGDHIHPEIDESRVPESTVNSLINLIAEQQVQPLSLVKSESGGKKTQSQPKSSVITTSTPAISVSMSIPSTPILSTPKKNERKSSKPRKKKLIEVFPPSDVPIVQGSGDGTNIIFADHLDQPDVKKTKFEPLYINRTAEEGPAESDEPEEEKNESPLETKIKNRDKILAAFNRLNGVTMGKVTSTLTPSKGFNGSNGITFNPSTTITPSPSPAPEQHRMMMMDMDDDDDDEDDDDHKGKYNPERLKAFNMFVRLFVDENLDRMIPISRQPKDKIQAIMDSCSRQFPELGDRSRKRIRTYLKSCRRTKKTKGSSPDADPALSSADLTADKNGMYHLTSPLAEQILATACDNEFQNAKRMRMGLKPIPAESTLPTSCSLPENEDEDDQHHINGDDDDDVLHNGIDLLGHRSLTQSFTTCSSSAAAMQVLKPANSAHSTSSSLLSLLCKQMQNGKGNDDSCEENGSVETVTTTKKVTPKSKKNGVVSNGLTTNKPYSLNPGEMAAVKQLISGYRESAAFLLRSADELEQLILKQT